jgi:DNA-binding XRE family transcriptional regulator
MPPEDLGALIVSYREKNQLTQFEFAEIIGLHRNTVINLEQGQTKAIRMDQLKRIMTLVLG